jgi:hypothetical protein
MIKTLLRLVLSPIVLFVIGYIYYGNTKDAYYIALIIYTILTAISLVLAAVAISKSLAKLNPIRLVRKTYKVIAMLVALGIYWAIYLISWA